ncbi:hypothetical protein HDU88_005845 [Geranomyces variabilis]|nr:hypothetical protein HDU88_005845 [Geranomyces variabilis]
MGKPTWTSNFFTPYLNFISDPEIFVKVDNTTSFSLCRPDIEAHVLTGRVAASVEIKSKFAKKSEMAKDLSRTIESASLFWKADEKSHETRSLPTKIAIWAPG